MTTITKSQMAKLEADMARPVDTKREAKRWGSVAREIHLECRWLAKASALYGRARVLRALRSGLPIGAELWVEYFGRWERGEQRHVVPFGVLQDQGLASLNVADRIALAPRVA